MSDKIGPLSFPREEGSIKPFSDETAQMMDEEVRSLVQSAYNRTVEILTQKREGLDKLANQLLEKEVVNSDDMVSIFGKAVIVCILLIVVGPRPWKTESIA
jgi:AFG3 family protein